MGSYLLQLGIRGEDVVTYPIAADAHPHKQSRHFLLGSIGCIDRYTELASARADIFPFVLEGCCRHLERKRKAAKDREPQQYM